MKRHLQTFILATTVLLGLSRPSAVAELGMRHFGVRGGVSANPDQFHGGVFLDAGEISFLRIQPSFEFGIGNGVRLGAANLDAIYPFSGSTWRPYAGGGLGVNFIDVTDGIAEGRGLSIEPVLNVIRRRRAPLQGRFSAIRDRGAPRLRGHSGLQDHDRYDLLVKSDP